MAVRVSDRLLVVEIRHIPYSPDNVADTEFAADVDGKAFIMNDSNTVNAFCGLTDDVLTLLHREEAALVLIDSHGHDNLVEDGQGPCEDVQMACREWIKRPRKQCYAIHLH